jgi:hypothetical protein
MKKYHIFIPRFEIDIKAKDEKEARAKASEQYQDWQDQDIEFGEFIIEEVK